MTRLVSKTHTHPWAVAMLMLMLMVVSRYVLTEGKGNPKDLTSNTPKDQAACIVNTVYLTVSELKDTNHIGRPSGDGSNDQEEDDTGDEPHGVKD